MRSYSTAVSSNAHSGVLVPAWLIQHNVSQDPGMVCDHMGVQGKAAAAAVVMDPRTAQA